MKILTTAGNTLVPIDQVRAITNIFTGRTGATIALEAHDRGHDVTLMTSHPETAAALRSPLPGERWRLLPYRTFDDLQRLMESEITHGRYDVIVHCAAVSDYRATGVYAPAPGAHFDPATGHWSGTPALVNRMAGKVKSDENELWIRLERTPKLADLIRTTWGFFGTLVKFKLEVGVGDSKLLDVAERSRRQSEADLMVANTLEGAAEWAYLGAAGHGYERVERADLARRLLETIETLRRS